MTKLPIASAVLLLCLSCGKDSDSNDTNPPRFEEPDAFFQLMNRYGSGTFIALTAAEIQAKADTIAIGRMVNVRKGLTYDEPNGVETPTMVADLEVLELLKGSDHEGHVYYGQIRPPVLSLETLQANLPPFDLLVFLMPWTLEEFDGVKYVDPTAGFPADVARRALVNPQGLLYEQDGRLVQPFATSEGSDDAQLYPNATSLDAVAKEIAAASSQ